MILLVKYSNITFCYQNKYASTKHWIPIAIKEWEVVDDSNAIFTIFCFEDKLAFIFNWNQRPALQNFIYSMINDENYEECNKSNL